MLNWNLSSKKHSNFNKFIIQLFNDIEITHLSQLYPESKQGIANHFYKLLRSYILISDHNDFSDMHLNDKNATNIGRKLVEFIKIKHTFQLLYTVSSARKTKTIFDMAMHEDGIFIIYIECKPSTNVKSIILESI